MRKQKTNPLLSMWLIIPAVVIMPIFGTYLTTFPSDKLRVLGAVIAVVSVLVGLFLLWKSARKTSAKAIGTAVMLLIAAGASFLTYQSKVIEAEPESGYNIALNSQGSFQSKRIFSLEYQVFNSVVNELRENKRSVSITPDESLSETVLDNNKAIYEKVGQSYGLSADTVEQIYLKVSTQMQNPGK